MIKKIAACAGLSIAALSQPAWSITGNDLIGWIPDYERATKSTFNSGMFLGYTAGVAEATVGVLFCPPPEVTNGQNAAIVAKWLRQNPERWAEPASNLVITALQKAYPKCKDA
ncbi:Rap1a/Tai family immunity protein [Pseudomonas sp. 382]|uniref:Rap1a/Tai family immunity protein n=2 Tax=Pseudomonas TaxID=286 RepID=UPI00117B3FF1|nr:Rap1a/Tai family immunity protein [Pseudomonas sp. 382]